MELHASTQSIIFLMSVLIGVILAVIFNIMRVARAFLPNKNFVFVIVDVLFFIICSVTIYLYSFISNYGEMRFYIIFGSFIGFFMLHMTIGNLIYRPLERLANRLKSFLKNKFARLKEYILNTSKKIKSCVKPIKIKRKK